MKKIISFALTALLCTAAITTGVSANKTLASIGDVPKTSDAITIDGKIDDVYKQGLVLDLNVINGVFVNSQATDVDSDFKTATGKAYFLYDDEAVYFAIEIKDDDIVEYMTEKQFYQNDGIAVAFDFVNDGSTRYKYFINYNGACNIGGNAAIEELEGAVTSSGNTIILEGKVALPEGVGTGSDIGLCPIIYDVQGDGNTKAVVGPTTSTTFGENAPTTYDYVVLSDKTVTAVKADTTTTKPTAAAQTADVAAVAALAALASGAVLVSKKRR